MAEPPVTSTGENPRPSEEDWTGNPTRTDSGAFPSLRREAVEVTCNLQKGIGPMESPQIYMGIT